MDKKELALLIIKTALKQELLEHRFSSEGFLIEPKSSNSMSLSNLFYEVVSGLKDALFGLLEIQDNDVREQLYFEYLSKIDDWSEIDDIANELLEILDI